MRELILAPSVLSADFVNLGQDIEAITGAGAKYIHFDVMDGVFVPNITFGFPVLKALRGITTAVLDVHLMITAPERYIAEFAKQGADIITFHYEATDDPAAVLDEIHEAGVKAGISIKPGTPVEVLFPLLDKVDMVLIMSVEPGFGGQKFMPESYDRIHRVYEEAARRGLEIDIEVDGGVSTANAKALVTSGVNILVAGSSVFKGDTAQNTRDLLEAIRA